MMLRMMLSRGRKMMIGRIMMLRSRNTEIYRKNARAQTCSVSLNVVRARFHKSFFTKFTGKLLGPDGAP